MTKLKLVEYDVDVSEYVNSVGKPLYKPVTVDWSEPIALTKDGKIVFNKDDVPSAGCLYAVVRNDRRNTQSDRILYIGLTQNLVDRFNNHWTVDQIRAEQGKTGLSIGSIDFGAYRTASGSGNKRAVEELEHIYIWTVWQNLWNERKQASLPGMGKYPGRAWDISNVGFRFSGRMPKRIVYPCITIQPRTVRQG